MESIENEYLSLAVSEHGAELSSIVDRRTGRECLWQADAAYWKRHSPVLFPIVGSLWDNEMRHNGAVYRMTQHGFARDMDFELVEKADNELRYRLVSNAATRSLYPFDFELEIGYQLEDNAVRVCWLVRNASNGPMDFQIGAHPAFNYLDYNADAESQGYFMFDADADRYSLTVIGEKGCARKGREELEACGGVLDIGRATFNRDAIVLEDSQVRAVTLTNAEGHPYLRVSFDAPVVGLWSPARDGFAPFVCIEPWYGRCDDERYQGDYGQKPWMQHLAVGETWQGEYVIEVL